MRFRVLLPALFLVLLSILPTVAHAAIPFFGPIIPNAYNVCAASWGLLITVINNIISLLITLAIVFVAPLMIAYSGFLFVVNPFNSGGIDKAKGILLNTISGIVIALAGWLIVNAVMAVLYNPTAVGTTWSQLIIGNANDTCLSQAGSLPGASLNPAIPGSGITGVTATGATYSTALSNSPGNPCNPATLMAVGASEKNAKLLACIAQGESTCGQTNPPYNLNYSWNKNSGNGKASTAAGAYQVLLASNSSCYDNPVCEAAGGTPGVVLNCKSGFDTNGFPIPGSAVVEKCKQAAGNVSCSAAAATCLLQKQSFAAAYATDPYTSACLNQYGG